jgi:hypothetical protein
MSDRFVIAVSEVLAASIFSVNNKANEIVNMASKGSGNACSIGVQLIQISLYINCKCMGTKTRNMDEFCSGSTRMHLENCRYYSVQKQTKTKLHFVVLVRKRTIPIDRPTDRRLSAKLVPTFTHRGCSVVRAKDPHGR